MPQAVSRMPPTAKAWVQSQATECGVCVGKSRGGKGFCPSTFGSPTSGLFHQYPTFLHLSPILHNFGK